MTKQYHDIVTSSIAQYTKELAERLLDGWAVSQTNPGDVVGMYGGTFTVSLYRDHNTVAKLKEKAGTVAEAPKPDRAAILAKAREAKAAKRQDDNS